MAGNAYTYTFTCTPDPGVSPTTGVAIGSWNTSEPGTISAGRRFGNQDTITFNFTFTNGSTLNACNMTFCVACDDPDGNCQASAFLNQGSAMTITAGTAYKMVAGNGIWTYSGTITDNTSPTNITYVVQDPEIQVGTGSPP